MRIAIVTYSLASRGGSQRYVSEIMQMLKIMGHEVSIFTYEYDELKCYPELLKNTQVYTFKKLNSKISQNSNKKLYKNILCKIGLFKVLNILGLDYCICQKTFCTHGKNLAKMMVNSGKTYDVLWAHEEPVPVYACIYYNKMSTARNKSPIVWFCYDTIEKWFLDWRMEHKSKVRKWLLQNLFFLHDKFMIANVDKIEVLDSNVSAKVKRLYNRNPIIVRGGIALGNILVNKSDYLNTKYPNSINRIIVTCISRMVEYRRIHDLLEMFRELEKSIKNQIYLYINAPVTCETYYKKVMKEYSDVLSLSNVSLVTDFPRDDDEMFSIYRSSDIFVYPNEKQTWGNAPLESMASGVATIVSSDCGIAEIMDKNCVFTVGNISELKNMIKNLVINNDERNKIAAMQYQMVRQKLSWDKICNDHLKVLYAAIEK